jgi:Bacterial SH3 domain
MVAACRRVACSVGHAALMSQLKQWSDEMKKFVLTCAMLVASVSAGAACDPGCAVVLKASDGYWNVRAEPNGKVLGRLHRGDTVEVSMVMGKWTRVFVHDRDVVGWVSSNGLQEYPCQSLTQTPMPDPATPEVVNPPAPYNPPVVKSVQERMKALTTTRE